MKSANLHPREIERQQALDSFELLDTLPEDEFDEITFLASKICRTPIALISLVDKDRQWFKSKQGLSESQTHRDLAFCAHAILQQDIFYVPDAKKDIRFSDNPIVIGGPRVEFYAGIPILDPQTGLPIGTLCVIDNQPRDLDPEQLASLTALRNQVQRLLLLRQQVRLQETIQVALQNKTQELENVLNAISTSAIVTTTDLKGKILEANEMFCKISGYSKEELIGQDHRIVNSGAHPKEFFKQMWDTILEGRVWTGEIQNRSKDGRPYFVRSVVTPVVDAKGRTQKFLAIRFDVTASVLAQRELETNRLKAMHNARLVSLGEMSAGIAHEINNPLALIAGGIPLLKRFRNDEEKFVDKASAIERAVKRINKIVNGLRKFSRSSGALEMKPSSVNQIIAEALAMMEPKLERRGVQLEQNLLSDSIVECDAMEIEQVVMNLVSNAIDAVSSKADRKQARGTGGPSNHRPHDVSQLWVKVVLFEDQNQVVLQVIDSGQGISEKIEGRLFEPFFTTKSVGEGTGLGLSICKGILDAHKATISVNRDFANTCFEVRFPKYEKSIKAA